jgi:hypothetical protein
LLPHPRANRLREIFIGTRDESEASGRFGSSGSRPISGLGNLAPLADALNAHYDQMSMDEILARIERLSVERLHALFEWLAKRVASG